MHVVEWPGQEPPLLAIHGSAGHAYGLTALGEWLAPDVRFLAIDLRGHGFSDKPPAGYDVNDHVQDILQLMATLRLRRPILLGYLIGGAIATFVAAAAGDDVGGLVLLDAVVGDRAFIESASVVVAAFGASLEQRFKEFDEYHGRWGREIADSEWKRWLERSDRMELAPLPDGTLRSAAFATRSKPSGRRSRRPIRLRRCRTFARPCWSSTRTGRGTRRRTSTSRRCGSSSLRREPRSSSLRKEATMRT